MPQLLVMHVVFRSLLKIFLYAAKQVHKLLQCNKANLLEPAPLKGFTYIRAYEPAYQLYTSDENIGGPTNTVTGSQQC